MRRLSLVATLLAGSAISTAATADGHLKIVDEPLELTIQMNHARYPVYEEDWPVEQVARELTGIHLINDTVGANMRTDENTGRTEALNLMLASGRLRLIASPHLVSGYWRLPKSSMLTPTRFRLIL